jgi:septal ring factor EnvC (AmiA/AmiB activator)
MKNDFEKRVKLEKIVELKKELKQLKVPLKSLNNEIIELKNVKKNVKHKLMRHYQELLYNGKEIRNEGLIWIIKAIWRLGENVPMSFMPTFLDFNAIKYLFNMARLSIELEAKKKFIIELRTKLKNEVNICISKIIFLLYKYFFFLKI